MTHSLLCNVKPGSIQGSASRGKFGSSPPMYRLKYGIAVHRLGLLTMVRLLPLTFAAIDFVLLVNGVDQLNCFGKISTVLSG